MPLVTFDDRSIDAIIESGTNANGSWIKFGNGVMICWDMVEVTNQTISNAYGNHYQGTRVMTFPQEFSVAPSVACGAFQWGTSASWGTVSAITKTNCTLRGIDLYSRASGTTTTISYIAIGSWE